MMRYDKQELLSLLAPYATIRQNPDVYPPEHVMSTQLRVRNDAYPTVLFPKLGQQLALFTGEQFAGEPPYSFYGIGKAISQHTTFWARREWHTTFGGGYMAAAAAERRVVLVKATARFGGSLEHQVKRLRTDGVRPIGVVSLIDCGAIREDDCDSRMVSEVAEDLGLRYAFALTLADIIAWRAQHDTPGIVQLPMETLHQRAS